MSRALTWVQIHYPSEEIHVDTDLDWEALQLENGGVDSAYYIVGRDLDLLVLIENLYEGVRTIGRGQFELARVCSTHGGTVGVFRDGRVIASERIVPFPDGDWKTSFAYVETEE